MNFDSIVYQILDDKYKEKTIQCASFVLANYEPVICALGIPESEMHKEIKALVDFIMAEELSFIAIDHSRQEKPVVGFALIKDFMHYFPGSSSDQFEVYGALVEGMQLRYIDKIQPKEGEILHGVVGGCLREYQNGFIFRKLIELSFEKGSERGFERCVIESNNIAARRGAEKMGFKTIDKIHYRDFTYNGKRVFGHLEKHRLFSLHKYSAFQEATLHTREVSK